MDRFLRVIASSSTMRILPVMNLLSRKNGSRPSIHELEPPPSAPLKPIVPHWTEKMAYWLVEPVAAPERTSGKASTSRWSAWGSVAHSTHRQFQACPAGGPSSSRSCTSTQLNTWGYPGIFVAQYLRCRWRRYKCKYAETSRESEEIFDWR